MQESSNQLLEDLGWTLVYKRHWMIGWLFLLIALFFGVFISSMFSGGGLLSWLFLSMMILSPLLLGAWFTTEAQVWVQPGWIRLKRWSCYSRRYQRIDYDVSDIRGIFAREWHNDQTVSYTLEFDTVSQGSVLVIPWVGRAEVEKLAQRLYRHIKTEEENEFHLDIRNFTFSEAIERMPKWGYAALALFFIPMMAFPSGQSSVQVGLPQYLNIEQQQTLERYTQNLGSACEGKEYCVIGFLASWCSASQNTKGVIPAMERYFADSSVGVLSFSTDEIYGTDMSTEEVELRRLKSMLGLGTAYPGFAVVHNNSAVVARMVDGVIWGNTPYNQQRVELFLRDHLGADQLISLHQ